MLLLPAGFLLIIDSESFIDAVLNATALLFIPVLDDELPGMIGLDAKHTIRDFLVKSTMQDLNRILDTKGDPKLASTLFDAYNPEPLLLTEVCHHP